MQSATTASAPAGVACRPRRQGGPTSWSLPFTPLEVAITACNKRSGRSLQGHLGVRLRQAYHRAKRTGRISITSAEDLCDAYELHPACLWPQAYPWLADVLAAAYT